MLVAAGCHLRQVCHREHLPFAAELLHQTAHGVGYRAADAGVDLVEDQRGRAVARSCCRHRNRQRQTRQLTARRHLGQCTRRAAGVAGDAQLDALQAEGLRLVLRDQRHLEAAACHAELLHRLCHCMAKFRRCELARFADTLRLRAPRALGLGSSAFERSAVGGRIELHEFGTPACQQRRQLFGRTTESPRQADPRRQARVEFSQALRVDVGVLQVAGQRMRGIRQLRMGALQHLGDGREARVDARRVEQRVSSPQRQRRGVGVGVRRRVERALRGFDQRLRMRQARVLGVELGPLALSRREAIDFADLPRQTFTLALDLGALRTGAFERRCGAFPLRPQRRQRRQVHAGLAVEQRTHGCRPRQALPRVLAMNVHQRIGGFAQLRHRGRAAVDPCAALALGVDRAAQEQRVARIEAGVFEPGRKRRR